MPIGKSKMRMKLSDGVVVWAKLDTFPWWPSVIINREIHEANLDPGESLPPATKENRMVEFFNDNQRVAVVDLQFLLEYTTNMGKLNSAPPGEKKDVLKAVAEAKEFIEKHGLPEQKDSLRVWEESKRTGRRKKLQKSMDASDNEDVPSSKTKIKIKKERSRSFSPGKKRDSADHRDDDDVPQPKRMKALQRRKSTGPASKKSGSSKKHKSKSRDKNMPATSETKDTESNIDDITMEVKKDEHSLSVAHMDVDDNASVKPMEDDGQRFGDVVKMESDPKPRSPNRSHAYIDVLAGTKKPSVDHILKKPKPIPENPIAPDSIKVVGLEVAEKVCNAVVAGAADYVKGIMEIASMRDELQKQMYKLQDKRDKLLKDIRELGGWDFTLQMLVDSGIGSKLVTTVDELRSNAVDPHNELVRVLNKWKEKALEEDGKNERRKHVRGRVEEEEIIDQNDGGADFDQDPKKATKVAKRVRGATEKDIAASGGERKADKSASSGDTGVSKNKGSRKKLNKERSTDKSSKTDDKAQSAKKLKKSEAEDQAPSKITRPSSAKSLDGGDSAVKQSKPRWEAFNKSRALDVLKRSISSYITICPPMEKIDAQEFAEILQHAVAAKCGDDKKLYFSDCKKVCQLFVHAASPKDEESRKHVIAFLESRDADHVIPASGG